MLLFYLFNSKSLAGERKITNFVAVKLCKVAFSASLPTLCLLVIKLTECKDNNFSCFYQELDCIFNTVYVFNQ